MMLDIKMPRINNVTFSGYLGGDPRNNKTKNGKAVCSFTVIQNKRYRTKDGEWKDAAPTAATVVLWGKIAEIMGHKLHKGSPVCVSGELQLTRWDDKSGNPRSRLEIRSNNIQALERTSREDEPPTDAYEDAPDDADQPEYTDDIPF